MLRTLLAPSLALSLFSLTLGAWAPRPALAGPPSAEQRAFEDSVRSLSAAPAPAAATRGMTMPSQQQVGPVLPLKGKSAYASSSTVYEFSDGNVDGSLGTSEMRKANRAAAEILQRRMQESRPDEYKLLREAAGADVVVVSGAYDRVQDVLRAVQIKHVVIPPSLLEKLPLLSTQTLMLNCPGDISAAAVQKVRSFVERGGYLVSTDWALRTTAQAFPGTIEHNGKTTPNDVVAVHVHDEKEPLLTHVKVMREHPRWWLEGASYPIRIRDKQRVRVLMSSEEMTKKYGDGAVVVAFSWQQGKVLHMTSHFFLQQSKLVAEGEKQKGSAFAKGAGLSEREVEELRQKGVNVDEVKAGELNSAYSMQQVSTNLIVEKQGRNKELLEKHYRARATLDVPLASSSSMGASKDAARVQRDFRLQVLEKKGDKTRVRDLFGNEGWVPNNAVAY